MQTEARLILGLKTLLYVVASLLYLRTLATTHAMVASCGAVLLGVLAAVWADKKLLRLWSVVAVSFAIGGSAFLVGDWVLDSHNVFSAVSAPTTIQISDSLFFGLLSFSLVFGLRTLAMRSRLFDLLEAAAIIGAVAHTFSAHRNQAINRPLFLSDWAWSIGVDPQIMLHAIGVGVAGLAALMLLRQQRVLKLMITLFFLMVLSATVYWWARDLHVEPEIDTNGLGLTSNEKGGKGDKDKSGGGSSDDKDGKRDSKGKGGGAGNGDSDSNSNSGGGSPPPPPQPSPVALAVIHEDYEPESGILYFRQQVLSKFDGHRLIADENGMDLDMLTSFPLDDPLIAKEQPNAAFHHRVPSSMFLLVDHPTPVSLSGAIELKPIPNPAPRRFKAAYDVITQALTLAQVRLVGRGSIPKSWSAERVAHYLETPDDPRYQTLADEITRDIDPRFADDVLMKALLIKRYLEKEGFYTRKERHVDDSDPAGSFLFGNKRGYCVHFAHATVHMLRSQGIAARVALGYAVPMNMRGDSSAVLITSDRAHAWPELHIDGVGWVTFDVYPEQSDEPPPEVIDQDLESLLGELARDDKTAGKGDPFTKPFEMPWATLGRWLLGLALAALLLGYLIKISRLLPLLAGVGGHRLLYVSTLDRFSDIGAARLPEETRETHARRLAEIAPSLQALTQAHLRATLGGRAEPEKIASLSQQVRSEYAKNVTLWKRALGWINPIGWWFTR